MSDLHLIQYNDGYGGMSAVLCPEHRPDLFDYLKRYRIGLTGMPAPEGARCDVCPDGKS